MWALLRVLVVLVVLLGEARILLVVVLFVAQLVLLVVPLLREAPREVLDGRGPPDLTDPPAVLSELVHLRRPMSQS